MSLRKTLSLTIVCILIATLVYAQENTRPKNTLSTEAAQRIVREGESRTKGALMLDMLNQIAAKKPEEITDEQLRTAVIEMANRIIALEAANQPRLQHLGPQ